MDKQHFLIHFRDKNTRKQILEILHLDKNLIVVNKPPFIPVIPDRSEIHSLCVKSLLEKHLQKHFSENEKVWVVHRLDTDTSGVMLFARNAEFHRSLSIMFENTEIEKTYVAIVNGAPNPPVGEIDLPIAPKKGKQFEMRIARSGKPSLTNYETVQSWKYFSLVKIQPKNGRTHQIRVHFQAIDSPLAVDSIYAKREAIFISDIKKRAIVKATSERPLLNRLSLHAQKISFSDPNSGEKRIFTADLPKDLTALIKALNKWNGK